MPGHPKSSRWGGCRWCRRARRLLLVLLWRGRRCCQSGCLAVLLGLVGLVLILWLGRLGVLLGLVGLVLVLLLCRGRKRDRFEPPSKPGPGRPQPTGQRVPSTIYRRPDPMIYSQGYLMSQGIAVTWDNPDVQLEKAGAPVPSHALEPSTAYEIVARVWNGSAHAPAVGLPVRFSYLEFGIGTVSHPIGIRHLDLPVKAAPGSPAIARIPWTTPAAAGHYCLQIELVWPDDANPANNLGQENTDVKALNSPRANFVVPVRNEAAERRALRLEVDSYAIGRPLPCPPGREPGAPPPGEREREERRRRARAPHARGAHRVPQGWTVAVEPSEITLAPDERAEVTVEVTAPAGFDGRQAFNLNALLDDRLVGGVTLIAEGEA